MKCVVGQWVETLDDEDRQAFEVAADSMARAELHRIISNLFGNPFGLTATKAHSNGVCCCRRESDGASS